MNDLKSNARLTGWVSLVLLILTAGFTYLAIKYYLAEDLVNFITASLVLIIVFYSFLRFLTVLLKTLMEIRRQELVQSIMEAQERWGFK